MQTMGLSIGFGNAASSCPVLRAGRPFAANTSGVRATTAVTRAQHPWLMDAARQKVVGEKEVLGKSRWLQLVDVRYTRNDQERTWQYCERCTRSTTCDVDAVVIFAIIKSPGQPNRVVIVKQFRPPLDTYTVELCAGLVDEGETVEVAALRELKEETGYTGKVLYTGGKQYLSPGLTNECVKTVFVEVDAANQTMQDSEDAGFIQVDTLPLDNLLESLEELESQGYAIWVGLYSIAQTLKLQSLIGGSSS